MYTAILKNILLPTADLIKGTEIAKIHKRLQETQWWTSTELEELQNEKLRTLIQHAYYNVPYYHRVFEERNLTPNDIETCEQLKQLPILTKNDVRKYYHELCASNVKPRSRVNGRTGGSTGEPLCFLRDKRTQSHSIAAVLRAYGWAGYNIGDKMIAFTGGSLTGTSTTISAKVISFLARTLFLPAFELKKESIDQYIHSITNFGGEFVRGYTSTLYWFAKLCESKEYNHSFSAIFATAEKLHAFQRETIQSQFQCQLFDGYGCGEVNGIAYECEKQCLHVTDEHVYVEYIHVPDSQYFELVLTDLDNYAMPFIRYTPGDLAEPMRELCPCGRVLSRIRSIEGRTSDFIIATDGTYIAGEFFPHLFREIEGIQRYQIVQTDEKHILLHIVKGWDFRQTEVDKAVDIMKRYVGKNMNIELVFVDDIELPKSGKQKFVVSHISGLSIG